MRIGNKIFELRTAKNLSQGDLAELLQVSRQSVSKWETDAAVPDLDKLMKLCDVFGVTLDELACRETGETVTSPSAAAPMEKAAPSMTCQRIIGCILLAVSLLALILICIFAKHPDEVYLPLLSAASLLACSLICLLAKQHAGYWCVWSLAAPVALLSPYIVGLHILRVIKIACIVFLIVMAFAAGKLFAAETVTVGRKKSILVISGWVLLLGLYGAAQVSFHRAVIDSIPGLLPYIAVNLLGYVGTALLLTYTVCCIQNLKTRFRGQI